MNNNPAMNRKSFLSLMNGGNKTSTVQANNSRADVNYQDDQNQDSQKNVTSTSWNLMNRSHGQVGENNNDKNENIKQEQKKIQQSQVGNENNQTEVKEEVKQKINPDFKLDSEIIEEEDQAPVVSSKKDTEHDFLSQFLDEEEARDLVENKSGSKSIFLEQQKIEEDKLRKMIQNINLEARYLLQKINERSDGRLNQEQINQLNQEVRLREKTRLKRLISNKKLSATLIKDKILISCLTLDQQKELIEILQNREELNLRNMIDNRFINHNYLLHQIHLTELDNEKKQSLLEALSNKVEQRLVDFMSSSYFDIQALLLEVNRLSFDGLLNVNSRQKLIEMLQLKEEEKLKKMIKNPYIESSDLLKEITLRSDGRLSDNQIKSLIGLVRQRL